MSGQEPCGSHCVLEVLEHSFPFTIQCMQYVCLPGQLSLKFLHCVVAFCVVFDLRFDVLVQVSQMVGLDGAEALHQQLGDLHLLVILGLSCSELVLGLGKGQILVTRAWVNAKKFAISGQVFLRGDRLLKRPNPNSTFFQIDNTVLAILFIHSIN